MNDRIPSTNLGIVTFSMAEEEEIPRKGEYNTPFMEEI